MLDVVYYIAGIAVIRTAAGRSRWLCVGLLVLVGVGVATCRCMTVVRKSGATGGVSEAYC